MRVKCVVCGREVEQSTRVPKLYCCHHCSYLQDTHHIHTKEWIAQEKERRTQAYIDGLDEDTKRRLKWHKKKSGSEKVSYYQSKPTQLATRRCHDCGKPCNNYRCDECWQKVRRSNGLLETVYQAESEWDDF